MCLIAKQKCDMWFNYIAWETLHTQAVINCVKRSFIAYKLVVFSMHIAQCSICSFIKKKKLIRLVLFRIEAFGFERSVLGYAQQQQQQSNQQIKRSMHDIVKELFATLEIEFRFNAKRTNEWINGIKIISSVGSEIHLCPSFNFQELGVICVPFLLFEHDDKWFPAFS